MRWFNRNRTRCKNARAIHNGLRNLQLEILEDRFVPATVIVNSMLDAEAQLTVNDLFNLGDKFQVFSVTYRGGSGINSKTIDNGDIYVTGKNGFSRDADIVHVAKVGNDLVASYRLKAPGGRWDSRDYGAYVVHLRGNQVKTTDNQAIPAQVLGSFLVRSAASMASQSDADTAFLLHGNKSLKGSQGENPLTQQDVTFTSGVQGNAIHFGASGSLQYATSKNISSSEGTIEFWIRPDWNGNEVTDHFFFQVGQGFNNGLLLAIDGANNLRTIMWGDDPTTSNVENNAERGVATTGVNWAAGEWHHFATTWKSSTHELSLYIDGNLVDSTFDNITIPAFSTNSFSVGSDLLGNRSTLGSIDELRISTSSRTANEIATDYRAGYRITRLQLQNLPSAVYRGDSFSLSVLAKNSLGATIDVTPMISWRSSCPCIASVDAQGKARALYQGTAVVTATLDGLKIKQTVKVLKPNATNLKAI